MPDPIPHIPVAVVGAGQAGLSISYQTSISSPHRSPPWTW